MYVCITSLNQNLDSTLNVVWNELKYKAQVFTNYDNIPPVVCNAQQINQVFMNILVNAAQAIEKEGQIHIATRCDNSHVEIEISDNGPGIPEENLSKIFDPFFTTKKIGEGTGLGLNLVYNIVQKHKGQIQVDSKEDSGTTFIISLPIKHVTSSC